MHSKKKRHNRGPVYMGKILDFGEVLFHRNLECGLYGACLDLVTKRRWVSFSCRDCELFGGHPSANRGPATVLQLPLAAEN